MVGAATWRFLIGGLVAVSTLLSAASGLWAHGEDEHGNAIINDHVSGDLRNIVRDLYGGDGITLSEESGFGHDAHFTAGSLEGLGNLNAALSSSLVLPSFNSVRSGFVLDLETGVPIRQSDTLGPLMAEDATTLGQGKLSLGFSYTRVDFDHFEGKRLSKQSLLLDHPDSNGDGVRAPFQPFPGGPTLDFELEQILIDIDIELEQDIFAIYGSVGLTPNWDIGIIVPIVRTRATAKAHARIIDPSPETPSPHFFDAGSDPSFSSTGGTKTGIGDVIIRTKYTLYRSEPVRPNDGGLDGLGPVPDLGLNGDGLPDGLDAPGADNDLVDLPPELRDVQPDPAQNVPDGLDALEDGFSWSDLMPDLAIGGQLVLPTGDHRNLLGTGKTRIAAVLIASKRFGKITPHINLGYEFVPNDHELNSVRYILGFDVALHDRVTLAADLLGRWEHSGDDIGDHQVDVAVGVKFNVWETVNLNMNVLVPVNKDEGLRADAIWSVGFDVTF